MKGISIDSILSVLVMLYFLILLKMGKLSRSIISIVLSSNLIGLYIIKKYEKRIPKNYKKLFYVSDIMLHVLPLLFIIFILKINLKKEENDINQIIIYLLIALTYLFNVLSCKNVLDHPNVRFRSILLSFLYLFTNFINLF